MLLFQGQQFLRDIGWLFSRHLSTPPARQATHELTITIAFGLPLP
jgi:hypothetical protein